MSRGWSESTRDRWVLIVNGFHIASAWRHRSWRRLAQDLPWHVEVLGNRWGLALGRDNEFATAGEAMMVADIHLRAVVRELAAALAGVES